MSEEGRCHWGRQEWPEGLLGELPVILGKSATDRADREQELTLPHSPRYVVFPPSGSRTPALPESIHLLYSPQSSVILRLDPSASPHLSINELPADPPPPVAGSSSSAADVGSRAASGSEGGGSVRAGVGGALSGLGGYVVLGGKAVIPVGTGTVGGEVLVARVGEQTVYRLMMLADELQIWVSSSRPRATTRGLAHWGGLRHQTAFVSDCSRSGSS